MLVYCISILAGAYATEALPSLPGTTALAVLAGIALPGYAYRRSRPIALVLTGFVLMGFAGTKQIHDRPDLAVEGQTASFTARIADFVKPDPVVITLVVEPVGREDLPARIRLNWLASETTPQIGDTWRLQTRLRRPRGYANPGGFDYEGWLFRQQIGATGYVIAGPGTYLVQGERVSPFPRIRRAIVARVERLLPPGDARAVLLATDLVSCTDADGE